MVYWWWADVSAVVFVSQIVGVLFRSPEQMSNNGVGDYKGGKRDGWIANQFLLWNVQV